MKDLEAVLGRLCFALGPLDLARPFLKPVYAWSAAMGRSGKPVLPWSMKFLFTHLANQFREPNNLVRVRPRGTELGMAFRADAKAEGQTVCVGGWECLGGTPPEKARWFSLQLDRRVAPWAFSRREPFRCTAALELYATLLCIMAFGDRWGAASTGTIGLTGITDNLGNTFAVSKLMSAKFPVVVILVELAAQLRRRELDLDLQWVPRDQNEEADALTNEEFGGFNPQMRVELEASSIQREVLPEMLGAAEQLYKEVQAAKAEGPPKQRKAPKAKPGEKLRDREPW